MKVGIWVEAEGKNRPFRSREEFEIFRGFVRDQPFTDFYCQVFREGRAWFQTDDADTSPFQLAQSFGVDPLREAIDLAHARGKKVHAWINVLRVDRVSGQTAIKKLGPDAVLTDNFGNSMLTYSEGGAPVQHSLSGHRIDTPGIWLDPSSSKVREYIVRVVEKLTEQYPDLDGVHLDMIRFPFSVGGGGLSFPYGIAASEEFQKLSGRLPPKPYGGGDAALRQSWDDWRRAQITRLVFDIKQALNAKHPTMELSAAVLAFPDRAFRSAFQDWQAWLRGGALDYAIPMNYTRDLGVFRTNTRFAVGSRHEARARIGIGAWLMSGEPELFNAELELARKEGADGVVLFSYSNLLSARGREFLRRVMAPFQAAAAHDAIPERKKSDSTAPATKLFGLPDAELPNVKATHDVDEGTSPADDSSAVQPSDSSEERTGGSIGEGARESKGEIGTDLGRDPATVLPGAELPVLESPREESPGERSPREESPALPTPSGSATPS